MEKAAKEKAEIGFLLLFLLLPVVAHAYIMAVSPSSVQLCLASDETRLANLTVSTNASTELLFAVSSNESWAQAWNEIWVPPAPATADLPILFNASGLPDGTYSGQLFICAPNTPGNISIRYCLGPRLVMDVSAACAQPRPTNDFQLVAGLIVFVLVLIVVVRNIRHK